MPDDPARTATSSVAEVSDHSAAVRSAPATEEAALLERVLFEAKKVIVGQDRLLERLLVGLLARGHCLIEGVPGLAKTLTIETVA